MSEERFWERLSLDEMNDAQWEALCDGCGRCCLQKLEDVDSGQVFPTDVACRMLDTDTCRCRDYPRRFEEVSDCLSVRPLTPLKLGWLPLSCAYRRLASGQGLADWHPLISGTPGSVERAGIGVAGRVVSEMGVSVHDLTDHVVTWLRLDEAG